MTETPDISIIIPVYNNPVELNLCLDSLEHSELRHKSEIIVVDDCSPDEGAAIEQAAQKYKARFYRQSENAGPGVARNIGAQEAEGKVLVFIDADCVAPPGWLTKLVQPIVDGKSVAATSCYCGPVHPRWITIFQDEDYRYRMPSVEREVSFVNSCNVAIERETFFNCGGFPEQRISHDMVLGLILSDRGTPSRYLPDAGVKHGYCGDIYSYLRQRFSFAFNTVRSFFNRDEIRSKKANSNVSSFNPIRTALGMLFVSIAAVSFISAGISALLSLDHAVVFMLGGFASLLFEIAVHGRFLFFLIKRNGLARAVSYIFLLYLIDIVYVTAVLKALINIIIGRKSV